MREIYGKELAEAIRASIKQTQEIMAERASRIASGQTDMDDCFLSQRIEDQSMGEYDMQLRILEGDGFITEEVCVDADDNEYRVGSFINQWRRDTYVVTVNGQKFYASSKKALCKKSGLILKRVKVPAWTRFCTNGKGLCGVYSGSYQIVRWHTNMVTGEYFGFDKHVEVEA